MEGSPWFPELLPSLFLMPQSLAPAASLGIPQHPQLQADGGLGGP